MTALTITLQWRLQCTDHHCSTTQPSEAPLCSPLPQHHLHSSSISSSEHSTRLPLHCDETATEMATLASARGHTNPRPRGPSLGLYSDCVLPAGTRTTWPPSFWPPSFLPCCAHVNIIQHTSCRVPVEFLSSLLTPCAWGLGVE